MNNQLPCPCESASEKDRIRCLVRHFEHLMRVRGLPLSKARIETILETNRLIAIKLLDSEVTSATEEFVESQILYTFIQNYCKNHPRFQFDGPDVGELKLKTTFFDST